MIFHRIIYPLIVPILLLSLALWLRESITLLSATNLRLLEYFPYALLAINGFLCIQFNQLRGLLIAVTAAVAYLVIQILLQDPLQEPATLIIFFQLSLLLPFLLILISWLPERGVFSIYGLLFFITISVPVIIAVFLYFNPHLIDVSLRYFPIRAWSFSVLSPMAVIIYCFLFIHQLIRLWFYQQPYDGAVSIIVLSLLINFVLFDQTQISITIFSSIQLMLIWSVLKQSHDMAYRDELTGLPGRRALNDALKSPGRKYVLAMMDIDHFKKFNDKYGHDIGDDVLKVVAGKIAQVTGSGRAFRYGGEEFTVLFKGKELETCIPHLEAVREEIAQYKILIRETKNRPKTRKEGKILRGGGRKSKPKGISVTISIGVAPKNTTYTNPEQVLKGADKALYKAKNAGRNCLVTARK
ncbi:MAG: GGDEF domain-containing protein [Gammaproteobacteria bacterium]|nr:GGDEF domain-containing protein [Gammaproteobacteria bacterium]